MIHFIIEFLKFLKFKKLSDIIFLLKVSHPMFLLKVLDIILLLVGKKQKKYTDM